MDLPLSILLSNADEFIKVGAVIYRYETETTPPKNKFSIIVGVSNDKISLARVIVNSKINPNIFNTIDLQSAQIGINSDENEMFRHYSYADCTKVFEVDKSTLNEEFAGNSKIHCGNISEHVLENIFETLRTSRIIKPYLKKKYGF